MQLVPHAPPLGFGVVPQVPVVVSHKGQVPGAGPGVATQLLLASQVSEALVQQVAPHVFPLAQVEVPQGGPQDVEAHALPKAHSATHCPAEHPYPLV